MTAVRLGGRILAGGCLRAVTPVSVGGLEGRVGVDLAVARDGHHRPYIPGPSLAGALRSQHPAVGEEAKATDRALWGFQEPAEGGQRGSGRASRLLVEDAIVRFPGGEPVVRDHVALERTTGAAAHGRKFDREVLPRGAEIDLRLTLELPPEEEEAERLSQRLGVLLQLAAQRRVRLGGGTTRGLGVVELDSLELVKEDLRSADGVRAALARRSGLSDATTARARDAAGVTALAKKRLGGADDLPPQPAVIRLKWRPAGPIMVAAGLAGLGVDTLPLADPVGAEGENAKVAFVLPGSSLKGAVRAHAERLLATLLDLPAIEPAEGKEPAEGIEAQLVRRESGRACAGWALIEHLFGTAAGGDAAGSSAVSRRGALHLADCYATKELPADGWDAVLEAPDEQGLRAALRALDISHLTPAHDKSHLAPAHHVAVDRWTGGAAEGLLFSVLEPHGISWEPIELDLALHRLPPGLRVPALGLLRLLLDELRHGRIPLGHGVNRGFGSVHLDQVEVKGGELGDGEADPRWLEGPAVPAELRAQFGRWVDEVREEAA